jgi:hypothetical protein
VKIAGRFTMRLRHFVGVTLVVSALTCGRESLDSPTIFDGATDAGGSAGSATGSVDAAVDGSGGRAPAMHRTIAVTCQTSSPPASTPCPSAAAQGSACATDSDCKDGEDGVCVEETGPARFCDCSYDACFSDDDCPATSVCACAGTYSRNTCLVSTCQVDADCGAGGFCSPVFENCSNVPLG